MSSSGHYGWIDLQGGLPGENYEGLLGALQGGHEEVLQGV